MQTPYRKAGKYGLQQQDPYLSQNKILELEQELVKLKKKRPFAASEVSRLAELGDFSENVEYQQAKSKLRGINGAITRIQAQLNSAIVINQKGGGAFVSLGSKIIVKVDGKEKHYEILGSSESNPETGIISHSSPIAQLLLDKEVGDKVILKLKDREVEYEILEIK
ncbi:MAG: transcription elongation factor GreA [Candidatus Magasanikbacteria bacterium CG_4_10_14_0_2_um_filter_33_14]|uniref:Transcription elongation factor GreA n=1 Tax=Candidatus Magasanikbacteria bacterium CG_4_10_14_0_2_um_filter_33_14 TaxID=1974636 RepID=A0A2M7VBI2_9BACT|nr:MAG: transcription elongation factor GreA [Candidatus Magasanikbacteria bacterium CG_4_10_14_0_2_um_filter_33_14]